MHRAIAALLSATAVAFVAGCGGCGSGQKEPAASASKVLAALADGDGEKACAGLTPEAQQEVVLRAPQLLNSPSGPTCPELVGRASYLVATFKDRLTDAEFINVSVSGNTATMTFVGAGFPITMEKRGDKWLISANTIAGAASRAAQNPG